EVGLDASFPDVAVYVGREERRLEERRRAEDDGEDEDELERSRTGEGSGDEEEDRRREHEDERREEPVAALGLERDQDVDPLEGEPEGKEPLHAPSYPTPLALSEAGVPRTLRLDKGRSFLAPLVSLRAIGGPLPSRRAFSRVHSGDAGSLESV